MKKLLVLITIFVLSFSVIYSASENPFSGQLSNSITNSLDRIIQLVQNKKSGLTDEQYANLVDLLEKKLGYLYYEIKNINPKNSGIDLSTTPQLPDNPLPKDENINLNENNKVSWIKTVGVAHSSENSSDRNFFTYVDKQGYNYHIGHFRGKNINFLGTRLSSTGGYTTGFIAKLDLSGNIVWVKTTQDIYSKVIGVNDSIYLMSVGFQSFSITKMNNSWEVLWKKNFGKKENIDSKYKIYDFYVDNNESIFVLGAEVIGVKWKSFIYKLDKNGNIGQKVLNLDGVPFGGLYGYLHGDNKGNLYVALRGNNFSEHKALIKVDYSGKIIWNSTVLTQTDIDKYWKKGNNDVSLSGGIAKITDINYINNNIYISGTYLVAGERKNSRFTGSTYRGRFISKISAQTGEIVWFKKTGLRISNNDRISGLYIDEKENLYVAGTFDNGYGYREKFLGDKIPSGLPDTVIYVFKLNKNGDKQWVVFGGGACFRNRVGGISGYTENIYLNGKMGICMRSSYNIFGKKGNLETMYDMFIVKLGKNGNVLKWDDGSSNSNNDKKIPTISRKGKLSEPQKTSGLVLAIDSGLGGTSIANKDGKIISTNVGISKKNIGGLCQAGQYGNNNGDYYYYKNKSYTGLKCTRSSNVLCYEADIYKQSCDYSGTSGGTTTSSGGGASCKTMGGTTFKNKSTITQYFKVQGLNYCSNSKYYCSNGTISIGSTVSPAPPAYNSGIRFYDNENACLSANCKTSGDFDCDAKGKEFEWYASNCNVAPKGSGWVSKGKKDLGKKGIWYGWHRLTGKPCSK